MRHEENAFQFDQPPLDPEDVGHCSPDHRRPNGFPFWRLRRTSEPEVKGAKLGFIALTDAAPLIVASEKGLFRQAWYARCRGAETGLLGCYA